MAGHEDSCVAGGRVRRLPGVRPIWRATVWISLLVPNLVAAAFGMDREGVMIYLADRVDPGRERDLPTQCRT
ncbi:hypothetical protein ACFV23_13375 [Streptomyces sp. NPDC059627]